jgi:hypothetical protein
MVMDKISIKDIQYKVKPTVKIERSININVDGKNYNLPFDSTVSEEHAVATANFLQNTPTGNDVVHAVDSIAKVVGKAANAYAEAVVSVAKSLRR